MKIELNGELRELSAGATVADLIDQLSLTGKRLAVEVNEDIVPRSQHAERRH